MSELYDLTIVGGGPAGLYAAFYAGMRDMKVKLIEGKEVLGGFLHHYAEKTIWDVGGIPPLRCEQLIERLSAQARTFDPTILLGRRVDTLERLERGAYRLRTDDGQSHDTRTILVAVGRGITEMTKLDIRGADRYELTNLHYTVQNPESYRGKRVLISGGGNSAVDWANELVGIAREVIVVHRRPEFGAMERSVARMLEMADVRTPYVLRELHGSGDAIRAVTIGHADDEEEGTGIERIDVDAVVVSHGYTRSYGDLLAWGLEIGQHGVRVSDQTATNLPGIFAAGDCATYANKVKLIAGAFTDAVLAVNSAMRHIDAEAPGMAYVSSHNEKFREMNKRLKRPL
ncbi:NAD(P)/FAD-dependent oxidoreductase [Paenibacillus sp. IB182496]|uniref:Ferredoxin--NADP reductase n=1 Tax=Paenibacillus sabuli TaxID=2772509 RepID=A0A927GQY0_9BACL|nr:NAD(P)/FAD-dependent oxidoreductase [Paenibacillus sabuli]MBD2844848.1 NAD(P)/FAD-dependent oxidoreductase [Paenibacillus sabuli]